MATVGTFQILGFLTQCQAPHGWDRNFHKKQRACGNRWNTYAFVFPSRSRLESSPGLRGPDDRGHRRGGRYLSEFWLISCSNLPHFGGLEDDFCKPNRFADKNQIT